MRARLLKSVQKVRNKCLIAMICLKKRVFYQGTQKVNKAKNQRVWGLVLGFVGVWWCLCGGGVLLD